MPKNNFFEELKRRNVYRVAITYGVSAWLSIQVASILFTTFEAPTWVMKVLTIVLIIGFPIALILTWAFEMSPQGMIRTKSIEADENPYSPEGKKPFTSSYIIAIIGLIIVAMYAYPRFVANPVEASTDSYEAPINDRSIAVLPFINRSGDPEQEALCIGLTENIIHQLGQIKSFTKVIPPSSVMRLTNSDKTLAEKAALLKVNTVLEGSFQQSGDRIKITAQLNDAVNDNQLWSEIYERPFGAIFEIQAEIAKNIAASLKAEITDEEEIRLNKKPTESSEAYILLKKGYYKMRFTNSRDFQGAIDLFKKAIETDPGLAEAYAALASAYLRVDLFYTGDKSIPVEDPLPLVQEALRLDPELAMGYEVLGRIKRSKEWNFPEAEAAYKKAVELDPQGSANNSIYGVHLHQMGRASEALPYMEKAVELEPTNPSNLSNLAKLYFYSGNKEKSTEIMEEFESLFQNGLRGGGKGLNYLYLDMLDKAIENLERLKVKENPLYQSFLAIAYTKNGQNQKAQPLVDRLKLISQKKAASNYEYSVGLYYSGTGQKEEALYWLERAYDSHDSELYWLKTEPMFKTLHGDPRYEELLRKIGFPE
jgi:serine/threonine-protein kinase